MSNFNYDEIKGNEPSVKWIKDLYQMFQGSQSYDDMTSQKVFKTKLYQAGTADPVTQSIINTTGKAISFSRCGSGSYIITGSDLFTTDSFYNAQLMKPYATASEFIATMGRSGSDDYGYIEVRTTESIASTTDNWEDLYIEITSQT